MKGLCYQHCVDLYKINKIVTNGETKTLHISNIQVEAPLECALQKEDTLDLYTTNAQRALEAGVSNVLIHSNPIATCEKCPLKGKGCKIVAADALEKIAGMMLFKESIIN